MDKENKNSFTTADISPEHLNEGQAERFANDLKRLLNHKNEFVDVPCPACGVKEYDKAFEKYGVDYVVCRGCETMYVNPRPTPEILEDYYSNSENYWYWNKYIFPASEDVRKEKIARPRVKRLIDICKRHNVCADTIVEVGAGFGTFCEEADKAGFFKRVIGIEPTPDLAETCRGKGLEVIESTVENVSFDSDTINVVASFETIEHLFSPEEFLKSCSSILSPGGIIVLTCPNVKGFGVSVLQSLSDAVDSEHLNYFHIGSLSELLEKCGFEILEAETPGKLDAERVRNAVLSKEFDITPHRFLKQILIDDWESAGGAFQQFLADNKLSAHMWIAARKKDLESK